MRSLPWLALVGCMGGPNLETQIGELRVVAARADPAAVAPDEPFDLELWVANPTGEAAEVVTWSCPEGDAGCQPILTPLPASDGPTVPFVHQRTATLAPIWILACPTGACGDLANPPVGLLRDPFGWLQTLPLSGVSAASRLPPVPFDPELVATNPTVETMPEPMFDRTGLEVALNFVVRSADSAFGLATSGGFDQPSYDVADDGTVTLTWVPDPEAEAGEVFVVFGNAAGGVTVWRADVP